MNLNEHNSSKSYIFPTFSNDPNSYSPNKLPANHKLCQDSFILSQNQDYYARLQDDGNFVLYKSNFFIPSNAIWSTNTSNKGYPPYNLVMQSDSNLVIYDKYNKAIWASDTFKIGKFPCSLVVFDTGTMGIIDGENCLIWETKKFK